MVMADTEVMAAMGMDIAAMVVTAMEIVMEMDTAGVTDVALMIMLLLLLPMLIPLPTALFIALPTAQPQLLSTALHLPLPTGMLPLLTPIMPLLTPIMPLLTPIMPTIH